jgi:cytidyltransferase-like protein
MNKIKQILNPMKLTISSFVRSTIFLPIYSLPVSNNKIGIGNFAGKGLEDNNKRLEDVGKVDKVNGLFQNEMTTSVTTTPLKENDSCDDSTKTTNNKKVVFTVGVFDYFHYGHLKLLERCKALGDYLIVSVQKGSEIKARKPNTTVLYSTEQRKEMISALRCVDEVIEYGKVDEIIKEVDFDIFVVGGDQNHDGFQRAIAWCEENGKQVVRLERTPNISSSAIKKDIEVKK